MEFLGTYKAGATVKYRGNFHNDTGTVENPTAPEAQREDPAGTFTALTAPAIINAKTGHYGGSVDTTGFASGQHFIRMAGTVATAKTVATEFCFQIVAYDPGTTGAGGLPVVGSGANNFKSDASANVTFANTSIATAVNLTNAPTNGDLTATMKTSVTTAATAATPSVTVSDKTGFSLLTAGILAIWHQLTSAIATAGSIGLGLARFVEYGFYQNGAVWIDTVGGTAGAEPGVNGTNRHPVNNIAEANTLAAALNLNRFILAPGSSVTFAAAQSTQEFIAHGATIALGGQNISNSIFTGAIVSGIGTGILPVFEDCSFLNITLPAYARARRCIFSGVITLGAASVYTWRDCVTAVTGASPPVIDFGALIGATTVNLRNYSGHVEIQNMGQVAGADAFFMEGIGDLTVNANCINNQAVTIRGIIGLTNNGSVTLDQDQRMTNNQIASYILLTPANKLATDASGYVTEVNVDGIKRNIGHNDFMFFMVDSADHVTGKTGLTITAARNIDNTGFSACANAVSEIAFGWYVINLAASDLNGTMIAFRFTGTGADARNIFIKTNL